MKLTAKGQLQHHFWGDYHASVGLAFETPEDAALALPKLWPANSPSPWKIGKNAKIIVAVVNSAQLEELKAHCGTLGADVGKIDSCDHSIDYGDPFTVTVDVEDPRQMALEVAL